MSIFPGLFLVKNKIFSYFPGLPKQQTNIRILFIIFSSSFTLPDLYYLTDWLNAFEKLTVNLGLKTREVTLKINQIIGKWLATITNLTSTTKSAGASL